MSTAGNVNDTYKVKILQTLRLDTGTNNVKAKIGSVPACTGEFHVLKWLESEETRTSAPHFQICSVVHGLSLS